MKLYFQTMKNKICIDAYTRTYKLGDNCEKYGAYVVVSQWEFDNIVKQLQAAHFTKGQH